MLKKILLLTIIILSHSFPKSLFAEGHKFAIGAGYPYFCIKYDLFSKFAPEIRYATGEGIQVIAARGYYRFYDAQKINVFTGVEAGYIIFDTLDIEGNGYEGSVFLGSEYFIFNKLSMSIDIAPTYIGLKDNVFDFTVGGIEWVTSIMLYYHF